MNRSKRRVLLLLSLVVLATSVALVAAAGPRADGAQSDLRVQFFSHFRCQRPLSAMSAFSDVAKTPKELNCDFGYFSVLDASVGLLCEEGEEEARGDGDGAGPTCNASLRVRFRRHADAAQRFVAHTGTSEDLFAVADCNASSAVKAQAATEPESDAWVYRKSDPWRFSVKLRSTTHASTVHYKGDNGYSMCCDALEGASCAWENATAVDRQDTEGGEAETEALPPLRQVIERCPLPLAGQREGEVMLQPLTAEDDDGEVFTAVITKPLHRLYEGKWEMHMDMWRQRAVFTSGDGAQGAEGEQLGRIILPFELNLQQLRAGGFMVKRRPTKSGGESAEEVMMMVPASVEEEHDREGDL